MSEIKDDMYMSGTNNVETVSKPRPKGRRGNGSKVRKSEAFRIKVGTKQQAEMKAKIASRLFMDIDTADLEAQVAQLHLTLQSTAVPLPIATRGVGIAASLEYSSMSTTWSLSAISEICTIHQYYRVTLSLVYYKGYLSRQEQGEFPSYEIGRRFNMQEELRQILSTQSKAAIATANIIASVGKVEATNVYHSVIKQPEDLEERTIFIYPSNIRDLLDACDRDSNDHALRRLFYQRCTIPGVEWASRDDVPYIANIEDVWPADYTSDRLDADVDAYSNLLTRVGNRLPKSFIRDITWSGRATKTALVCCDIMPIRMQSHFRQTTVASTPAKRKSHRGVDITLPSVDVSQYYLGDDITGSSRVVNVWSPDNAITQVEISVGSASLVGETATFPTRLQIQGVVQAQVAPVSVMSKLVDAPRTK